MSPTTCCHANATATPMPHVPRQWHTPATPMPHTWLPQPATTLPQPCHNPATTLPQPCHTPATFGVHSGVHTYGECNRVSLVQFCMVEQPPRYIFYMHMNVICICNIFSRYIYNLICEHTHTHTHIISYYTYLVWTSSPSSSCHILCPAKLQQVLDGVEVWRQRCTQKNKSTARAAGPSRDNLNGNFGVKLMYSNLCPWKMKWDLTNGPLSKLRSSY